MQELYPDVQTGGHNFTAANGNSPGCERWHAMVRAMGEVTSPLRLGFETFRHLGFMTDYASSSSSSSSSS